MGGQIAFPYGRVNVYIAKEKVDLAELAVMWDPVISVELGSRL